MVRVVLADSQRGQLLPTSLCLFSPLLPLTPLTSYLPLLPSLPLPSYLPQQLSGPLSTSQCLSAALYISVHLCSFPPRLAARSGLCSISAVSLCIPVPLCTLRESLASLSLAVVALAGSRGCFSGSYGTLSHTWAFIKSLILKDKFEYLYKDSLIYTKMLDM